MTSATKGTKLTKMTSGNIPQLRRHPDKELNKVWPDEMITTPETQTYTEYFFVGTEKDTGQRHQLAVFRYIKPKAYPNKPDFKGSWEGGLGRHHLEGIKDIHCYKIESTHKFIKEDHMIDFLLDQYVKIHK